MTFKSIGCCIYFGQPARALLARAKTGQLLLFIVKRSLKLTRLVGDPSTRDGLLHIKKGLKITFARDRI